MASQFLSDIGHHKLLTLRGIVTGWTFAYILSASHDDELLTFYGFLGRGLSFLWSNWATHRWVFDLIPVVIFWIYWGLCSWLIARFHEPVGRSVVLAFVLSYAFYHAFEFAQFAMFPPNFYAVDRLDFAHVLIVWAIRDIGVIACILIAGRVFPRKQQQVFDKASAISSQA